MMTSSASTWLPLLAATAILVAGVVDDLRSKKFHNWLFLACCGFALLVAVVGQGMPGLLMALMGFAAGIAVMMPLVLLNIIGAGDMKLVAAFGIVAGYAAVFPVAIASLVWGAIFGLVKIALNGQAKALANNMFSLLVLRERQGLVLHRIPFAVAIFMGWLTHLVLRGTL